MKGLVILVFLAERLSILTPGDQDYHGAPHQES